MQIYCMCSSRFSWAWGIAEAHRQGKPVVMSFHVQPGNILNNLGLSSPWLTKLLYKFFVWRFYSRADRVLRRRSLLLICCEMPG